jgi:uncharacterized pyridoxamine 5'-phosphate oxidase family protein
MLAVLKRLIRGIRVNERYERETLQTYISRLNIKLDNADQMVRNLSGGNQQKVVLAKWLAATPKILIFDEPTRGIDVGAKYEIYRLIGKRGTYPGACSGKFVISSVDFCVFGSGYVALGIINFLSNEDTQELAPGFFIIFSKSIDKNLLWIIYSILIYTSVKEICMKEVYDFLKKCGTYYLATVEGDQPRVRPFGTVDIFENRLYIQTGKVKNVSKQIRANPKIEICAFNGDKWIRVQATAVEDDRREPKLHMLESYPELKNMYSADDNNTQVLYLTNAVATIASFGGEPQIIKF